MSATDAARAESLRHLATPEGRAAAIRWFQKEGYTAEQARMLANVDVQRCLDPRSLTDVACCYGVPHPGVDEIALSPAPTRRNEMPNRKKAATVDSRRQLETLEKGIRQLRRENAAPIVAAAVDEGRIAADETCRWLERAEKLGVDVVRDLLRERRPNRQLAAAASFAPVTAEQDAALAEMFPGYEPRNA